MKDELFMRLIWKCLNDKEQRFKVYEMAELPLTPDKEDLSKTLTML